VHRQRCLQGRPVRGQRSQLRRRQPLHGRRLRRWRLQPQARELPRWQPLHRRRLQPQERPVLVSSPTRRQGLRRRWQWLHGQRCVQGGPVRGRTVRGVQTGPGRMPGRGVPERRRQRLCVRGPSRAGWQRVPGFVPVRARPHVCCRRVQAVADRQALRQGAWQLRRRPGADGPRCARRRRCRGRRALQRPGGPAVSRNHRHRSLGGRRQSDLGRRNGIGRCRGSGNRRRRGAPATRRRLGGDCHAPLDRKRRP